MDRRKIGEIAKPLANVFIVSFIAIGVAFGTENFELLGLLQGFFPILAIIVLYYSLKLLTAQERSLMFPFLLIASVQSITDSYTAFESTRQGLELDNILLEHISLLVYIISLHWGYKSVLPKWGLYATLLGGASQIVRSCRLIYMTLQNSLSFNNCFLDSIKW